MIASVVLRTAAALWIIQPAVPPASQPKPDGRDDLTTVVKDVCRKCLAHKSLRANVTIVQELGEASAPQLQNPQWKPEIFRGGGSVQCLSSGDRRLFRWELNLQRSEALPDGLQNPVATTEVMMGDGEFVYTLSQTGAEPKAEKRPGPGDAPWPFGVVDEIVEYASRQVEGRGLDVIVQPPERVDDQPVYVIEARFREYQGTPLYYMPVQVVWKIQQDTGLPIRQVEKYADGRARTTTFTNIQRNVDIPLDNFKFQPPAGVPVIDRSAGVRRPPAEQVPADPLAWLSEALAPTRTIHYAAQTGNIARIETCLAEKTDINSKDDQGRTPLHMAVEAGQLAAVKFLLDAGADVNAHASRQERRLDDGAGGSLVYMGYDDGTALQTAASHCDRAILELLLANGADPNARDGLGDTPLHAAAEAGCEVAVELLMAKGADVTATNCETMRAQTPAQIAAAKGNERIVKLLSGATVDPVLKATLLSEALAKAIQRGDIDDVRRQLAEGADVNAPSTYETPPLNAAAASGRTDVAALLLEHGAAVNALNRNMETPLICAARGGHKEMVELLLAHEADVNASDSTGATALIRAMGWPGEPQPPDVQKRQRAIVELLLAHGAALDAVDREYGTPLHLAARMGDVETVKLLLAKGADPNVRTIKGLVRVDANVQVDGQVLAPKDAGADLKKAWTPLHEAAFNGHAPVIAELLARGAKVDVRGNWDDSTPLGLAAWTGHEAAVDELLAHRANPNAQSNRGRTPLHGAAEHGHVSVVEKLLRAGADVNAKDKEGLTPLALASKGGHKDVVKLLKAHGATE